tara:strand:+ start:69 stop:380 length:312 start_codon:yes stop_codon:yes gene_type:complete
VNFVINFIVTAIKTGKMVKIFQNLIIFVFFLSFSASNVFASPKNTRAKTKFYNFDDLIINGEYKKPQILYTDARQKVKFERLLKLKKDFIPKLKSTQKDPSLR